MKINEIITENKRLGPDMNDPYEQGWYAQHDDKNPYPHGTPEHAQWQDGHDERESQPNHYDESVEEGKTGPGLWANIHAKRERIKKGSGERMRKPGSKGAPTAANFKSAAKTEGVAEGSDNLAIGQQMARDGIEYDPAREGEIISQIGDYLKRSGMTPRQIRGYMMDDDFVSDQLSYLPRKSKLSEFAPSTGGDDDDDDGFDEDTLKRLAAQWYNGDEDPKVEQILMAAGWEIGQDEGYEDEHGVFVVMSGDENGKTYISWPADELRSSIDEMRDPWKEKYFGPTAGAIKKIFRVRTNDKAYNVKAETEQQAREIIAKHAPDSEIVSIKFVKNLMAEAGSPAQQAAIAVNMKKAGKKPSNESSNYGDLDETAAWKRKEGKSKTGGLNKKGVASYRRENPGSKLQTAVTTKPSKLKPGSKPAKRRKSFCARMSGMKGPMKDEKGKPTRKALALRKWNC